MKGEKAVYTVVDPNEEGAVAALLHRLALEKLEALHRKGFTTATEGRMAVKEEPS